MFTRERVNADVSISAEIVGLCAHVPSSTQECGGKVCSHNNQTWLRGLFTATFGLVF